MATAKQMDDDDITECPICTEEFTDPRVLPCGHTYCLKCIEAWSTDRQPGDELACPLCRKQFTLTSSGFSNLPKNFFVANILQMKELSSVESERLVVMVRKVNQRFRMWLRFTALSAR